MRRAWPLLLLPFILQCQSQQATTASGNPCDLSSGVGHDSPQALVCVDAAFTAVNPEHVRVKGNQHVDFYITGGVGELDIQFAPGTPVNKLEHAGYHFRAHAKAVSSPSGDDKYVVIDRETGRHIDPTILIEP